MRRQPINLNLSDNSVSERIEPYLNKLVEEGKKNGYLTYSEMNSILPQDLVTPERVEAILGMLDEQDITLVDDDDADELDLVRDSSDDDDDDDDDDKPAKAATRAPRAKAVGVALIPEVVEKIDDPVRMYLTQMGEIPLLTRDEEISLARKIELTRKQFRKLVLVSGFGTAASIQILKDVVAGELAFDRTIKVNQQDPDVGKSDLQYRLPGIISTLETLYRSNQEDFRKVT
ncbi:MAG: hypothetical protein KDC95_20625, partial [Planctomycetes bacterium]|nr:hypothetical protein [Planctomycetota bacterium]